MLRKGNRTWKDVVTCLVLLSVSASHSKCLLMSKFSFLFLLFFLYPRLVVFLLCSLIFEGGGFRNVNVRLEMIYLVQYNYPHSENSQKISSFLYFDLTTSRSLCIVYIHWEFLSNFKFFSIHIFHIFHIFYFFCFGKP